MYISSSTVTLTSCTFTSNTAVRCYVQFGCLMLQTLTSLFLSLFCRSVDFRMCVNCRRCLGQLPDVENTNLSLPVSFSNLVQGGGMYIRSSTVTLTSCSFTSNTAVRSVVQVGWLMLQILTSLFGRCCKY